MSTHTYKFNIGMSCGGCSGAVERVLKKLDGEYLRSSAANVTGANPSRRRVLQRLPRNPDRRDRRRRLARLRDCPREDQEDRQEGQVRRGRRPGARSLDGACSINFPTAFVQFGSERWIPHMLVDDGHPSAIALRMERHWSQHQARSLESNLHFRIHLWVCFE
jgi:copper chaperone CopZ